MKLRIAGIELTMIVIITLLLITEISYSYYFGRTKDEQQMEIVPLSELVFEINVEDEFIEVKNWYDSEKEQYVLFLPIATDVIYIKGLGERYLKIKDQVIFDRESLQIPTESSFMVEVFSKTNTLVESAEIVVDQVDKAPVMIIETSKGNNEKLNSDISFNDNMDIRLIIKGSIVSFDKKKRTIGGRGNSTWKYFEKKPYSLKMKEEVKLFNGLEGEEFLLLSNALDYSLMRNYLAFSLGHALNLECSADYHFVHLFLNKEYRGLYSITKNITLDDKKRADYLIRCGGNVGYETGVFFEDIEGVQNNWNDPFTELTHGTEIFPIEVMNEDRSDVSYSENQYMYRYLNDVNRAILLKNWGEIHELVDMESLIKYFLINQILLSGDMGYDFYLHKDEDGKLQFGPLWDFDQSSGVSSHGGIGFEGWKAETGSDNLWFSSLITIPEFRDIVKDYWIQHKVTILSEIEKMDQYVEYFKEDIDLNYTRWNVLGQPTWRLNNELIGLDSYEENYFFLKEWLFSRVEWIDNELGF